ncbi:SPX domain-containing protein 1-like [Amaranthus tricolor]|uniref:SPX domain-containing protein 1-like n=1 Tax=Amaranthus tricolor TaxID=29722 RepID=UPI00258563F6|nr:SPX domain-containing protein 1-like [Amaranthus tricolor]
MKFWKILSYLILQTLPDWRDKFLSYKDLKKQLKLIYPINGDHDSSKPLKRPKLTTEDQNSDSVLNEVNNFIALLEAEIDKFNTFVVEKEEEYVIRWKELQDRLAEARHSNEELMRVGREVVDFHGEMVLLENYSALNYTGLVKILKKYDKRSGSLIRLPFIQKVLQEPFYTNDTISKLVKECEATLDRLFSQNEPQDSSLKTVTISNEASASDAGNGSKESLLTDKDLPEIEHMENMYMKLTLSALRALKEIRSGSSTVNAFSLPPLDSSTLEDETWKKIPFIEQAAK